MTDSKAPFIRRPHALVLVLAAGIAASAKRLFSRNAQTLPTCCLMLCCIGSIFAQGRTHQVELGARENAKTLFSEGGTDHYLGGDAPNEFGPGRVIFELRCQPGSRSLDITVRSSVGNSSLPERSFEDVSYRGTSTKYALDLLLRLNSNETQPVSIILGRDDSFTFYINNSNLDAHDNILIGFKRFETVNIPRQSRGLYFVSRSKRLRGSLTRPQLC